MQLRRRKAGVAVRLAAVTEPIGLVGTTIIKGAPRS